MFTLVITHNKSLKGTIAYLGIGYYYLLGPALLSKGVNFVLSLSLPEKQTLARWLFGRQMYALEGLLLKISGSWHCSISVWNQEFFNILLLNNFDELCSKI